jgi:hypothetical protein
MGASQWAGRAKNGLAWALQCVGFGAELRRQKRDQYVRESHLRHAAAEGALERVKLLIDTWPAGAPLDVRAALMNAAEKGRLDCLKFLIRFADPKDSDSMPLRLAAGHGHADCVRFLMPLSDPKAHGSWALLEAATHGHADCVRQLIPFSEPAAEGSRALCWAARAGRSECVELLLPVSDLPDDELLDLSRNCRDRRHGHVCALIDSFVEARSLSAACSLPSTPSTRPHAL